LVFVGWHETAGISRGCSECDETVGVLTQQAVRPWRDAMNRDRRAGLQSAIAVWKRILPRMRARAWKP